MSTSFVGKTFCEIGPSFGDNLELYLRLGMKGLAIEAHPELSDHLRTRFATSVSDGQLEIWNVAASSQVTQPVQFACLPEKLRSHIIDNERTLHPDGVAIQVETVCYQDIVARFCVPDYLAVRVCGHEDFILNSMAGQQLPRHICANFSSAKPIAALYDIGYRKFRFVNVFLNRAHRAIAPDGAVVLPSSGAWDGYFGELLPGKKWLTIQEISEVTRGLPKMQISDTALFGWFDIHACL